MNKRDLREKQAMRVVPLRNYGTGKIYPECLKKRAVSNSDTGKEYHD